MSAFEKPSQEDLKRRLNPLQYACTQEEATERPFENEYWNHKEDGIYVDVVSGEALFSSLDKYDSGSGWPSFTRPLSKSCLKTKQDFHLGYPRVEVRSSLADSHLGHVFDDGPSSEGLRYCINSAALLFVPLSEMKQKGYGTYLFAFAEKKSWEIALLAGGCFWGLEDLLSKLPGVLETQVGYCGGHLEAPTYPQVKKGDTGHAESIQILFDPQELSFKELLLEFFKTHDPTSLNRQGGDRGAQYRSAIFYLSETQASQAKEVMKRVNESRAWKAELVTELKAATPFWPAEEYHQKYLEKNPGGYTCHFRRDIDF